MKLVCPHRLTTSAVMVYTGMVLKLISGLLDYLDVVMDKSSPAELHSQPG